MLHDSGTAAIQTSRFCPAKQNSLITLMYFGGIAFLWVELLRGFSNLEFSATLERRLNQSRASAVLQSNLIAIKFGTAEARRLNWALDCEQPLAFSHSPSRARA